MRTLQQLAKEAYDVQNASNLPGVLRGFVHALDDLRAALPGEDVTKHPVVQLWADKVASLTDTQTLGHDNVMDAYRKVGDLMEAA